MKFLKPLKHLAWVSLALPMFASAGVNFFDPTVPSAVPESLSQAGIYTNMSTKVMDTAVKYFEVNSALWSDAAHKDRWVILPPGKQIPYVDTTDVFDFPEGTIFVKLFRHDTAGVVDSTSRIYWETRLLVKKTTDYTVWHGFSYRWNKAGTNAKLVNRSTGFDTTMSLSSAPGYRKWHFPSAGECERCHLTQKDARAILGFWPAQLKRPTSTGNQVTDLFAKGVFSGTQPGAAALGRRFRGMNEPIPTGLSAADRFKVIDTMARSYIAANCSGCHGNKGLSVGATGGCSPNYDFYNLVPQMEFNEQVLSSWNLDGQSTIAPNEQPSGRAQFLLTLKEWGINTGAGGFDTSRVADANLNPPALVNPGHPTFSTILYRQAARLSPATDSGALYRNLYFQNGANQDWKTWIFANKWGSAAWKAALASHNVTMSQVFAAVGQFDADGSQMPPLATYIPDTAALKIMGEWAKNYPARMVAIHRGNAASVSQGVPQIQNRVLTVPAGWTGKAVMTGVSGRSYALPSAGPGRYVLPTVVPTGIYFFKVGDHSFRTSILR